MSYHEPVLAKACIEALALKPGGRYVDATFGGGGHSRLILNGLDGNGRLYGFDQDDDALRNLLEDERFIFNHHNFRFIERFMRLHGVKELDGVLADLGVSSHQIDEAERGFSYRFDAELDMRMNQSEEVTAATIVNSYSIAELQKLFSDFGEVRNAKTLAQKIVEEREVKEIRTIGDFLRVIQPVIRGFKSRYLSQVFQALRIEVNDEMGALRDFLEASGKLLKPGGRLVVISYHSLEDRMVKNLLKTGNVEGVVRSDFYGKIERPFTLLYKGVVVPSEEEIKINPRARSAKMRVGIKN